MRDSRFLVYFWTTLVGGAYGEFRGDLNYHTETPSPPTIFTMAGPTHVLVHVNPEIHKVYAEKIVDYYDKPNLTDFAMFCRCWRSGKFPYCDGFHNKYNEMFKDNVGPLIVRRRNVTNAARYYRRMQRYSVNWSEAGTPPLCTATLYPPTPPTKRRRPHIHGTVDVDEVFRQQEPVVFNFTNYLSDFIHMEERFTTPEDTTPYPTTEPTPTLMYTADRKWFAPDPPFRQF